MTEKDFCFYFYILPAYSPPSSSPSFPLADPFLLKKKTNPIFNFMTFKQTSIMYYTVKSPLEHFITN